MLSRSLCVLLLLLSASDSTNCDDDSRWLYGLGSVLKNCPSTPWSDPGQREFFDTFRNCVHRRALVALDTLLTDDIIPVIDGIDLIRLPGAVNFTDDTARKSQSADESEDPSSWAESVLHRLKNVFRTHVLKIDVDVLTNEFFSPANASTEDRKGDTVQGRRRHRRRHHMMPMMMLGLLLMGSIVIPMGFQFLAVLGGKALILAKMALILSSIQGLKKIATNGINYGLYHSPIGDSWHERSDQEPPPNHQYDLPYPLYQRS